MPNFINCSFVFERRECNLHIFIITFDAVMVYGLQFWPRVSSLYSLKWSF